MRSLAFFCVGDAWKLDEDAVLSLLSNIRLTHAEFVNSVPDGF